MRHVFRLLAATALFAAIPVFAADSLCPETVDTRQAGAAPAPEWSVSYSTSPTQLEMVTFYSGHPKDEASLVYDDFVSGRDSSLATWKFPRDARGYWVKCSYRGTTLELSKPLSSTVSSCRVTYDRGAGSPSGLPAIRSVVCR
jgi:hypothetical protein